MTSIASSSPDGLTLALNGAEERLQIALGRPRSQGTSSAPGDVQVNGGVLIAAQEWTVPGESVRFLAPSIKAMLGALGRSTADITHIACVRGPGSFTGLRLSLALVAGIAAVHGQAQAGLDYLPLLARRAAPLLSGPLAVITHSRRRQVYIQIFGNTAKPYGPPCSGTLEEAAAHLQILADKSEAPISLLGSGLRRNAPFFEPLADTLGLRQLGPEWDTPSPQDLLDAACDPLTTYLHESVEPMYMRPSDAEENLDTIARQRGLDPETARDMLRRSRNS